MKKQIQFIIISVCALLAIAATSVDSLNGITITSGTYAPALFIVANLDATPTPFTAQYIRVGNTITVSGKVLVNPTTTLTLTQLGISLPVASLLTQQEQVGGTASASGIASQSAAIRGDATNDRAEMAWIATDVTDQPMYFTFTYLVQ